MFGVAGRRILTDNRYDNMYEIGGMKYVKDGREIIPYFEYEANGIGKYRYDTLRLGEQNDGMERTIEYINKLESQMLPLE